MRFGSGHVRAKQNRRSALSEYVDALLRDLRYTCRSLAAAPGLTIPVIILVALGVGANAAVFSVINQLFLRPPSRVAQPDAIRRLYLRTTQTMDRSAQIRGEMPYPASVAIAEALGSRAAVTAYTASDSAEAGIGTEHFQVIASYVTPNFLSVLGVPLARGRGFDSHADPTDASQPAAVISYAFWQSRFGGSADVLGKSIDVTKQRYTIIGVTAKGFSGADLDRADVWLPVATYPWQVLRQPWYMNWHGQQELVVLARLARSTDPAIVAPIATAAYRRGQLANVSPADTSATVLSGPLLEMLGPSSNSSAPAAITTRLIGAALILLLVACANAANLLLLRAERRRKEIAVRLALGMSRRRLVVQLLGESIVLSSAGAVAAILVGAWGGTLLRAAVLPWVFWATSALDARVAGVAIGVAVITGVVAGVVPGLRAADLDLVDSLKIGAGSGAYRSRLRTSLVVVQGALSVVLLVGAGLFIRSLHAVRSTDVGYDVSRVAYGQVWYRDPVGRFLDYSRRYDERRTAGFGEVVTLLRNSANIEDATAATHAPMAGLTTVPLFLRDGEPAPSLGGRDPGVLSVATNFMSVTGLRLARGRWFQDTDRLGSPPVIVVNETAAQKYWPGRDALGECLILLEPQAGCATVVGITRNSHAEDIIEAPVVELFVPIAQQTYRALARPSAVIVRARPGRTAQALADLRLALARTFPTAEARWVETMEEAHAAELRPWRVGAELFALLGALALIVATFGMYSAMAYVVSQRTRELGVRIALGAPRTRIISMIVAAGARPLGIGLMIGIGLAVALGRLVATMLYATTPSDPLTLAAVSLVLLMSGLIGMLVPAYRAVRVDAMTALRAE